MRVDVWPTVAVLLAVAPAVVALLAYGPDTEWGTLSAALSQSGSMVPPAVCVLGFAASNLVHLAVSGEAFPLLVLPAYAATILSTYTGTGGVEEGCGGRCVVHALSLWVLIAFEVYVLLVYVRVTGWIVWPALFAFVGYAVVYATITDEDGFDTTNQESLYLLRSTGIVQLLYFLATRSVTASRLYGYQGHCVVDAAPLTRTEVL